MVGYCIMFWLLGVMLGVLLGIALWDHIIEKINKDIEAKYRGK